MTAAEIMLVLYWAVLTAIWAVVVFSVGALVIRVVPGEGGWLLGLLTLIVAGLVSVVFVWRARRGWQRALARPVPGRGVRGWLWRQPGWRMALMFWLFYAIAAGVVPLGVFAYVHGGLPGYGVLGGSYLVLLVIGPAVLAAGQSAGWCVIRQRHGGGLVRVPGPGAARGSRGGLRPAP